MSDVKVGSIWQGKGSKEDIKVTVISKLTVSYAYLDNLEQPFNLSLGIFLNNFELKKFEIKVGSLWQGKNNEGDIEIKSVGNVVLNYAYLREPEEEYDSGIVTFLEYFEPKKFELKVGDTWSHKVYVDFYVDILLVKDSEVHYLTDAGETLTKDASRFLELYSFHSSPKNELKIDSVWRNKEIGELVYIESYDKDRRWGLNFNALDGFEEYADNAKGFLQTHEFVCDSRYDSCMAFNVDATVDTDAINPSHYQSDPSGVQCIEISENWTFCLGNALKYMWRSGKKDSTKNVEDLRKAIWYIEREIARINKDGL